MTLYLPERPRVEVACAGCHWPIDFTMGDGFGASYTPDGGASHYHLECAEHLGIRL